jgi:Caspase domain
MRAAEWIDRTGSHAILIGVSRYQDLAFPPVPAAANSLRQMYEMLIDPSLGGWLRDCVTVIPDPVDCRRQAQMLRRAAERTSGALLIYYVGHGTITTSGELCLTLTDTDVNDPDVTGLEYVRVRDALRASPAQVKAVILDCCYSGRAHGLAELDNQVAQITDVRGVYTLTAADLIAHVVRHDKQMRACTSFTGELLDLIHMGIPGTQRELTLSTIYTHLRQRLMAKGFPRPNQSSTDTANHFIFARNVSHRRQRSEDTHNMPRASFDTKYFNRSDRVPAMVYSSVNSRAIEASTGVQKLSIAEEMGGERTIVRAPTAISTSGKYILYKWQKASGDIVKFGEPLYQYSQAPSRRAGFQARADMTGVLCEVSVLEGQEFEPLSQLAMIKKLTMKATDEAWKSYASRWPIEELAASAELHRKQGHYSDYQEILEYIGRNRSADEVLQFIGSLPVSDLPASADFVGKVARSRFA